MSYGPLTIFEILAQKLLVRWTPKWHSVFWDEAQLTCHERLKSGFKPVDIGYRRLLTQCRQLAVYSHAASQKGFTENKIDLAAHFKGLKQHFYIKATGGWRFSINNDGTPKDNHYDFYAHSFVVFALAHYFKATGDSEAYKLALTTLQFIKTEFKMPGLSGYAEALDENLKPIPAIRRQNPHMHCLEACLFAAEIWDDAIFKDMADEMVTLFLTHFYDADKNALYEWLTDDLKPHPEKGNSVEPGHYFEWIWLLKKHAELQVGDKNFYNPLCFKMLEFANRYGWDEVYGGIYDEVDINTLKPLAQTKRIWPFTEAIKANALMLVKDSPVNNTAFKKRLVEMVNLFNKKYIEDRGFWTERLNRDLTKMTDYMPGTTPYHVYFGIMETLQALRARGKSKSIIPVLYALYYKARRKLSAVVQAAFK